MMGSRVHHTKYGTNIPHQFTGCVVWIGQGKREWLFKGALHKEDGPAVVEECYGGRFAFYLYGEKQTEESVELYYMLKYKRPWRDTWWRKKTIAPK